MVTGGADPSNLTSTADPAARSGGGPPPQFGLPVQAGVIVGDATPRADARAIPPIAMRMTDAPVILRRRTVAVIVRELPRSNVSGSVVVDPDHRTL